MDNYRIYGSELSDLFSRDFSGRFKSNSTFAELPGKLSCKRSGYQDEDFSILHFKGEFYKDVNLLQTQGESHVSLHFQLEGLSDARISGFKKAMPMNWGEFNIINCVNPTSDFTFPQQRKYEYISICISPDFFMNLLEASKNRFDDAYGKSLKEEAFTLFPTNVSINRWSRAILLNLLNTPVAEDLKLPYLRSKIMELFFISAGHNSAADFSTNATDRDKLMAVKEFLDTNFLESLSLKAIARQFQLNEFKLKKGFKEQFNSTVFGYIIQLRMNYAYQLLLSQKYSVSEVAALVGYQSDTSFIRAFKSMFNSSPGLMFKPQKEGAI